MIRFLNWLSGWRRDVDGWLVRAKRSGDPCDLAAEVGFVEEAAIAVRNHRQARALDRGKQKGGA